MECSRAHNVSSDSKLFRWSAFWDQIYPPSTRAEMTCIPLHKTWQMNLLWPIDPPQVPEQRCLEYHYKNLANDPTLANDPPKGWSEKDEVHIDNTYACSIEIQIYPPKGDEVKEMKCIWITHMHAMYRFRHTPQDMKCTRWNVHTYHICMQL